MISDQSLLLSTIVLNDTTVLNDKDSIIIIIIITVFCIILLTWLYNYLIKLIGKGTVVYKRNKVLPCKLAYHNY